MIAITAHCFVATASPSSRPASRLRRRDAARIAPTQSAAARNSSGWPQCSARRVPGLKMASTQTSRAAASGRPSDSMRRRRYAPTAMTAARQGRAPTR